MEYTRCPNPFCGRPFQVNQFSGSFASAVQRGMLTCPHCGLLLSRESESVFLTHALSSEQEAAFNAVHSGDPVSQAGNQMQDDDE